MADLVSVSLTLDLKRAAIAALQSAVGDRTFRGLLVTFAKQQHGALRLLEKLVDKEFRKGGSKKFIARPFNSRSKAFINTGVSAFIDAKGEINKDTLVNSMEIAINPVASKLGRSWRQKPSPGGGEKSGFSRKNSIGTGDRGVGFDYSDAIEFGTKFQRFLPKGFVGLDGTVYNKGFHILEGTLKAMIPLARGELLREIESSIREEFADGLRKFSTFSERKGGKELKKLRMTF